MNRDLLLKYFDRINDAPDAIPRVRQLILDLAVRGKLVEQNSSEEPALSLLTSIRGRLSHFGRADNPGILDSNHQPFALPSGWLWTRLGDMCSKTGSGSTPRGGKTVYQPRGIPFLRSQNVYDDGLRLDDVAYIKLETHEQMAGTALQPDDLLLNITGGSIGRCCRVPPSLGPANVSQHVAIIRPAADGVQAYLHCLIRSPYFQDFVIDEQTGAGRGGLPKNRMDQIPVALPPLAEQHRIVAKVDELMALCDQLEAAQMERESRRDRLAAASLHHLNNGANAEARREDVHFFLNLLPRVTTRFAHIKQLRQTILDLAVRGRLVSQDPSDESAEDLLRRIQVDTGKRGKNRETEFKTAAISPELESPFDIPVRWKWTTLGKLAHSLRYGTSVKCAYEAVGHPVLRIPNIENGRITVDDLKFGPLSAREAGDLQLQLGDILIVRSNGSLSLVGRPALVESHVVGYCYAGYLVRVRVDTQRLNPRYLVLMLSSEHIRQQIEVPIRTTVGLKNVNATELSALTVPLPPLREQHRIVGRVDELMALCDQLEVQLAAAQTQSLRLLEAVLHETLAPSAVKAA